VLPFIVFLFLYFILALMPKLPNTNAGFQVLFFLPVKAFKDGDPGHPPGKGGWPVSRLIPLTEVSSHRFADGNRQGLNLHPGPA
jgi:hypothetical protein